MGEPTTVYVVRPVGWEYNDEDYSPRDDPSPPVMAFRSRQRAEAYRDTIEAEIAAGTRPSHLGDFGERVRQTNTNWGNPFYLYEVVEARWEGEA